MGTVSTAEMRALEASACAAGWSEEKLMHLAGESLGRALALSFPSPGTLVTYLGKGHNAGDALIAARWLRDTCGWEILLREAYPVEQLAPLTLAVRREFEAPSPRSAPEIFSNHRRPLVLLDGLLGIGARGPLRPPLLELAREMRFLQSTANAFIAAVDLPSGTNPDSGETFPDGVSADITFMIGTSKTGLLHSSATSTTGRLALVDVPPLRHTETTDLELICPQQRQFAKSRRPFDFHKGQAGRVSLIAGSAAYSGAAVMAATGALRGGAGLVTLFVPLSIKPLIGAQCPPEIIIRGYEHPCEALEYPHDALVVGCGLGEIPPEHQDRWIQLLKRSESPTILDADALNFLAKAGQLDLLAPHHLLTPHPGEFARLAPDLKSLPREIQARTFILRHPTTLLLKGSRTLIASPGHPLFVNSTGTPAMATGGQGDLLAGVIGALVACGLPLIQAASLAAWTCGRAAEISLNEPHLSEESLTPSDVAHFLGAAFSDWKNSAR
ncbi:MAG: NAD(P)H-hydrate dehydratase [Luteolibacter sp.]